MKIGLVGWGVETQSAFAYFGNSHTYTIYSEEPRDDFPVADNVSIISLSSRRDIGLTGNASSLEYLTSLPENDKIILTPVSKKNIEKVFGKKSPIWEKITTVLEIFFEDTPTKNIVGVTGSKGKGTTTTLVYSMLKEAGFDTYIGGNIGRSPLDFIHSLTPDSWVVLEMSNFQLYRFPYSPRIAVHLMMIPEHLLEWHIEMGDYVAAKSNLVRHQKADEVTVYLPTNEHSHANAMLSAGKKVPYTQKPGAYIEDGWVRINGHNITETKSVKLRGQHNLENICAAVTAIWHIHQDVEAIERVLRSFSGLEHRLELAGTHNSITFYDDSFGTTPDTTLVALDAFREPKVLIVGGHEKGGDFLRVAQRLTMPDIQHVVFIGLIGEKLYNLALSQGFEASKGTYRVDGNSWTMKEIVDTCVSYAKPGDVVLLSCGTSSFGIFKDYKDRGNQFKACVQALASPQQQ